MTSSNAQSPLTLVLYSLCARVEAEPVVWEVSNLFSTKEEQKAALFRVSQLRNQLFKTGKRLYPNPRCWERNCIVLRNTKDQQDKEWIQFKRMPNRKFMFVDKGIIFQYLNSSTHKETEAQYYIWTTTCFLLLTNKDVKSQTLSHGLGEIAVYCI